MRCGRRDFKFEIDPYKLFCFSVLLNGKETEGFRCIDEQHNCRRLSLLYHMGSPCRWDSPNELRLGQFQSTPFIIIIIIINIIIIIIIIMTITIIIFF